jgi:hypothetical protein
MQRRTMVDERVKIAQPHRFAAVTDTGSAISVDLPATFRLGQR